LEELRALRRLKVSQEEEITGKIVRELKSRIEEEMSSIEIEKLTKTNEFEQIKAFDKEEYEKHRTRRKISAQNAEELEQVLQNEHRQMIGHQTIEFENVIEMHRSGIANAQEALTGCQEKWVKEETENSVKLEKERSKFELTLAGLLAEYRERPGNGNNELDMKVTEKTKARNRARDQFLQKPMRKEEHAIVQRLERALALKTQQLVTVGKELLLYRQQLITQEDEYNCRFGVDPSVAVLAPKGAEKKRPTTSMAHRLPKLGDFGSLQ
jgi:hypothetical protein